jgi:hypothetical protein
VVGVENRPRIRGKRGENRLPGVENSAGNGGRCGANPELALDDPVIPPAKRRSSGRSFGRLVPHFAGIGGRQGGIMFGLRNWREKTAAGDVARSRPALTARWLRDAVFAHRLAFEREMQRDRDRLERRFKAYLEKTSARQD